MQNLDNALCYVAYAGGFALGSYLGMGLERKLAIGTVLVNVITRKNTLSLQKSLKKNNYGFTQIGGKDIDGKESIIFIFVKRKELNNVERIIKEFNPNAFFSVEDVRDVNEGRYPLKSNKKYKMGIFKKFFILKNKSSLTQSLETETVD